MKIPVEFSEDKLVEVTSIEIFKKMGYMYKNCMNETVGALDSDLGRLDRSEVILKSRLRDSLKKINDESINDELIEKAIEIFTKDRSDMNIINANKEIHDLLINGVQVEIKNEEGKIDYKIINLVEFNHIEKNDLLIISQFWIQGELHRRRPDLIGFINGIPLIFIELKASHKKLKNAYDDNLSDYKETIPQIFWYNTFIILSNGTESKIGTISSSWEHFNNWKKIDSEDEEPNLSLNTILNGTCKINKFIDILENFVLFQNDGKLIKILAKYHQYLGVNNAIESYKNRKEKKGKLGVFWHTQGAGKSFSMIFFCRKILRKIGGNPKFLIVTDRETLDSQIYRNFETTGTIKESDIHAESGGHLRKLLQENHQMIFTLIFKFRTPKSNIKISLDNLFEDNMENYLYDIKDEKIIEKQKKISKKIIKTTIDEKSEPYPLLSDNDNIVVIVDEAHRTQYDELASNMRTALPNANFIAFTGTPLIEAEEKTREVFGDYISEYNFLQSIDDGATVNIYYESRFKDVNISKFDFDDKFDDILDKENLSVEEVEKLRKQIMREYEVLTREDRLKKVAKDIVFHFFSRGFLGKALVVSVDKPTTVKMYNYFKIALNDKKKEIKDSIKIETDSIKKEKLTELLDYITKIDFAVMVSDEQNEEKKFKKLGLDIKTHRKRIVKEDLREKFKDKDDDLSILFVCGMLLTGYDAPCLSTLYIDKPIKKHVLMQAIARVNRVFGNKEIGLIIDYCEIFRYLEEAFAIYATPNHFGGATGKPVSLKLELLKKLEKILDELKAFFKNLKVDILNLYNICNQEKLLLIQKAVNAILTTTDKKNEFLTLSAVALKLYKAILPDKDAKKYYKTVAIYYLLAEKIRSFDPEVNVEDIRQKIRDFLDETVTAEDFIIKSYFESDLEKLVDLSKMDLTEFKDKFGNEPKNIQIERLKNYIKKRLEGLLAKNRTRGEFPRKYRDILEKYNESTTDSDVFYQQLIDLYSELTEEENRSIRENLSEEELAIMDLLLKEECTDEERESIKTASKSLIKSIKPYISIDWRKKYQTRTIVSYQIQETLKESLGKIFNEQELQTRSKNIYQHIFESYIGPNNNIYAIKAQ